MAKYTITYHNTFEEKYIYSKKQDSNCIHTSIDLYEVKSLEECKEVVKNFMDVPEAELTFDLIRKEFGSVKYPLSDAKVEQIKTYYNGRLALYNKILSMLDYWNLPENRKDTVLTYDIPDEYNSFTVDEEFDDYKQIASHISIKIEF